MKRYGTRGKVDEKPSKAESKVVSRRSRRGTVLLNGESDEEEEDNSPQSSKKSSLGKRRSRDGLTPDNFYKRTRTQDRAEAARSSTSQQKDSQNAVNGKTPTRSTRSNTESPKEEGSSDRPRRQGQGASVSERGVGRRSANTNNSSASKDNGKTSGTTRRTSPQSNSDHAASSSSSTEDSDSSSVQEISDAEEDSGDESDESVQEIEESEDEDEEGEEGEIILGKGNNEDLEAALLALQREYDKKLQQKDEEILRLKHDLEWKEEQITEINALASKNLDLESRLSQMLGDPKCYEVEVSKFQTEKENEVKRKKEETKKSETVASSKTEEGRKPKTDSAKKDEPKSKKDSNKKEEEAKSKKDKQNDAVEEKKASEEKSASETQKRKRKAEGDKSGEKEKKRRSRRGKKKGEEEEEGKGEDIDALFVSDDDDDDVIEITQEETKKKETEKETKKDATKESPKKTEDKKSGEKDKDGKDEEGDDDEDDDDDKQKGRKHIRKLMSTKKLAEETVQAAKEEKERRERVAKLKELHVRVDEKPVKDRAPVTSKLILATKNNDMKTSLVQVNNRLIRKLKPHQVDAVEFLWDNVIESMENFKAKKDSGGNGCILAHCMGLGKTLSVITFIHTLMTHKCVGFKTCLVVAPLNTVLNWKQEFNKWLEKKERLPIYELASCKDNHQRSDELQQWMKKGGVMIMGYQIFRILVTSNTRSKKKKQIFDQSLQDPGPDVVVCDEGHMLKNDVSLVAKCMNKLKTPRRVVLTGTPLQNNLIEYHCMVNFVKPNLLGTRKEFGNRFVNPIMNGQHADSTPNDVKLMKRRAHVLHEMLSGCVQRRDYSSLVKFLPPKEEYVISVRLSPLQMDFYKKFLERLVSPTDPYKTLAGASLFSDYQQLMRIWTHPWVLRMNEIREEKRCQYDEDELDSEFETDTEDDTTTSSSTTDDEDGKGGKKSSGKQTEKDKKEKSEEKETEDEDEGDSDVVEIDITPRRSSRRSKTDEKDSSDSKKETNAKSGKKTNEKDDIKSSKKSGKEEDAKDDQTRKSKVIAGEVIKSWKSASRKKDDDTSSNDSVQKKKEKEESWWSSMLSEEQHKKSLELSGKLVLMFEILRMAQTFGDKVLVFSQSLLSLDLIEDFLSYKNAEYEETKSKKGPKKKTLSSWLKDEDYIRMDGSTAANNRKRLTEEFNDSENTRLRLFLISTRAGGLGINLDSANRVIIFDASWNPSHDIQSIFRVYRFGQEKPVCVYRFLAQGTMEEKIYERQVTKETLSQRVIDENQLDRHFTASDLQELYIFKPARLDDPEESKRPTPKLPKDLILTELLSNQKDWIVGYHQHDSLLEKRPEENLSEDERKKAWEEYERDKQGLQGLYATYRSVMPAPTFGATNMFGNRPLPSNTQFPTMFRPIRSGPPPGPSTAPMDFGPVPITPVGGNISFQVSQLPRVVQEILKYNPNISPGELQNRLQAFLGMHARYTVPGFAVPISGSVTASGSGPVSTTSSLIGNPPLGPLTASATTLPFILPAPVASTSDQPSRLPLPGKVPANK